MPVSIKGSGGGSVTLDAGAAASATTLTLPNVSGTVLQSGTAVTAAQGGTGLTSPGTSGNVLTSNGTAWTSAAPSGGGQIQNILFASSSTWTCPTGVTKITATAIGGGGGGVYNSNACGYISYGGIGGCGVAVLTVVPGTVYTITVGAGGAGVSGNSAGTITGNAGGTTSLGALLTVTGAGASTANGSAGTGSAGATGSASTTGTLLRSGAGGSSPVAGILGGNNYTPNTGNNSAVTWTTSSATGAGAGGFWNGSVPLGYVTGGASGAVLIQYVG